MPLFDNLLPSRMKNQLVFLQLKITLSRGETKCKFKTSIVALRTDNTIANIAKSGRL